MKKLIMLILLVMMSLTAFSQKDTTKVVLKSETARLVIKDLITGDAAKEELVITRSKVHLLENKISLQDQIITDLTFQKKNYLFIIENKDKQLGYSQDLSKMLQSDLKKQKLKGKLFGIGGGAAVLVLGFLVISK